MNGAYANPLCQWTVALQQRSLNTTVILTNEREFHSSDYSIQIDSISATIVIREVT